MTTQIEAQRLSGVDRGKHVRFTGTPPRHLVYEGTLVQVKHLGDGGTTIVIRAGNGRHEWEHVESYLLVELTEAPLKLPCEPRH